MITAAGIVVARGGRRLLDDVSVAAEPGRVLAVLGGNGAGKSTLLRVLAGELMPDAGTVRLGGRPAADWPAAALARFRAVMPQATSLAFPLTVEEVAMLGRLPHAGTRAMRRDAEAVATALSRAGIAHLARRGYATLSGGEQARAHLARVLAQADSLAAGALLLDEPTASLDLAHQHGALAVAREEAARGRAVVVVLHDVNLAFRHADDALLLAAGRVIAAGPVATALHDGTLAAAYGVPVRVLRHPLRANERMALVA